MKSWRTLAGAAVSLLLHVAAIVVLLLLMREPVGERADPDQTGRVELVLEEHKGRPDAGAPADASAAPAQAPEPEAKPVPPPTPPGQKPEPPPPAPETEQPRTAPSQVPQPAPQPAPEPVPEPVPEAPATEPVAPQELPVAPAPQEGLPAAPPPPPPPPAPPRPATPRAPAAPPTPRAPPAPPAPQAAPRAPTFDLRGDSDMNALVEGGDMIIPASPDKTQRNRPPNYPESAARRGQQGVVVVLIHVSPAGTTASADIAQSSGYPLLDQAALEAVRTWRFLPAVRDGQAVPFDMPMRFVFSLN